MDPMRLLPDNSGISWVPYLCLSPVLLVPINAYLGRTSPGEWLATGLAVAIFLALYFWSFWVRGSKAVLPIAGMATLGLLIVPFNSSGNIFLLYASGFVGFLGNTKHAVAALAVIVGAIALQSWLVG